MNFNDIKEPALAFWQERNAREKNMLLLAFAAIVLALVYLIFLSPALNGRAKLQKSLPVLHQQAAELQGLANQAKALETNKPPPAAPMTKQTLETSLSRQGLKAQNITLTGELAKVQFAGSSFAGIVMWLDEMQKTSRIALVDANFEALAQVDSVNAILTLRQTSGNQASE
jgi:general secretion pathway protein M